MTRPPARKTLTMLPKQAQHGAQRLIEQHQTKGAPAGRHATRARPFHTLARIHMRAAGSAPRIQRDAAFHASNLCVHVIDPSNASACAIVSGAAPRASVPCDQRCAHSRLGTCRPNGPRPARGCRGSSQPPNRRHLRLPLLENCRELPFSTPFWASDSCARSVVQPRRRMHTQHDATQHSMQPAV